MIASFYYDDKLKIDETVERQAMSLLARSIPEQLNLRTANRYVDSFPETNYANIHYFGIAVEQDQPAWLAVQHANTELSTHPEKYPSNFYLGGYLRACYSATPQL